MKEFVMRGQTASGETHTINFSGHKGDYGFKLTEFKIYPSDIAVDGDYELAASLTAAKTLENVTYQNFNNEGLIGSILFRLDRIYGGPWMQAVINDTFIITQDMILAVLDNKVAGTGPQAVNWQLKFMPVKLSSSEAALTNYRQFSIFDE